MERCKSSMLGSEENVIDFDGRVALVTGSGRGLGAAYARLLASRGAQVMVHDAGVDHDGSGGSPSFADIVVEEISQSGGHAMASYEFLGKKAECNRLVEQVLDTFGSLDILIHNAGLVIFEAIENVDEDHFNRMMDVHVNAPFWLAQSALPIMKHQNYGRIVLTTSGRALYLSGAVPGLTTYNIGKMAQVGLMNALAAEVEGHNIRVNTVSPVAATRMLRRKVDPGTHTADQVAPGVVFLASEQCNLSGIILRADNGKFSTVNLSISEEITLAGDKLTPEGVGAWLTP